MCLQIVDSLQAYFETMSSQLRCWNKPSLVMVTIVCVYISFSGWRKTQIYFIIFQDNVHDAPVVLAWPWVEPFNHLQLGSRRSPWLLILEYFVNVIEFPQNPQQWNHAPLCSMLKLPTKYKQSQICLILVKIVYCSIVSVWNVILIL